MPQQASCLPFESRQTRAPQNVDRAVRARCPIFVDDSVMDRAGVSITDDETDEDGGESAPHHEPMAAGEEENLTIFRDFINTLDIDDLDTRSN